ncbi:MAG: polyribonucleotide nucleotidyltransferase, partial [bacterium]|nr:polyribonucleotide nucleotidyltransferase [bacterium]
MAVQSSGEIRSYELAWGGRTLSVELGKYAGQANGACLVRYGDTVVLATAVLSSSARDGIDYFPLMVDFEERLYAAGKIKGSRFIKREGRPTDEAILAGRLIDRCIRPLFPDGMRNDVQVVVTTLSWDGENDSDILGIVGASLALSISDIPWSGPIGGIRIGRIAADDDSGRQEWVVNPTYAAREKSLLDLVVAGTGDRILMVEAGANEMSEDAMKEAMRFACKHLRPVTEFIANIQQECGKSKWQPPVVARSDDERRAEELAQTFLAREAIAVLKHGVKEQKEERIAVVRELGERLQAHLLEQGIPAEITPRAWKLVKPAIEAAVNTLILDAEYRIDGRALTAIRPLHAEVAALPRTHGSGFFKRGQTHVLSVVTLGAPGDEQVLDTMEYDVKKRYMHHYNFPPFSVGESRPMRGPGRREIGHGALAERALEPVLPTKEAFPYTIRVVSEVMSSNGSSSMGSTCGSTLALMDAGVPLTAPVAGIAMGLASDAAGRWKVLTDLQDLEDGHGGMDFKIAGTSRGITAVQMDTKTAGLTLEICDATFDQARDGRMEILATMATAIATPRTELSPYAPRVETIQINPDKIREIIGPGGKVINEIQDKCDVQIDIEQTGLVFITSTNADGMARARQWINDLTREVGVGEIFRGPVTRLLEFGAFVEVLPGRDGLVHVSQLAPWRVEKVTDVVNIGDVI